MKKMKYDPAEYSLDTEAPATIVPIVLDLFPATKSVIDFGCGAGIWLKNFKDNGVEEIFGLDGDWYNKDLLFKHINEDEFKNVDLETLIHLDKVYDLVVSLEVAEHISEQSADIFVQSLVNAGKIILFSAAMPGQGGYNHINEQFPSYWANKFKQHGYKSYDIIRRKIWNKSNVEIWYRQNMFIVAHNSVNMNYEETEILSLYHPDTLQYIEQGRRGIMFYSRLLLKSVINKFKK